MSEVNDEFVKKGFWINWQHGYVMGQTLTVEARTGTLLVALLTILSSIATAQLWNLVTFFFHQYRANGEYADGLHWQHQALLRTMPTPTSLMADTLKLSWTWRSTVPRALLRGSLLFSLAFCFAIAAIAAGISTSFAIDNSNIVVLVDSPYCGRFNYTKIYATRDTSTLLAAIDKSIEAYTSNCYQNSSSLPAPCRNTFSQPRIQFNTEYTSCPWNVSMCRNGSRPAIVMDSGLVDLRTHFGLNTQPQETVKIRRRTTCNVLPTEGHIILRNASWFAARGFTTDRTTLEYGTYTNTDPKYRPEATFLQSTSLTDHQQSYGSSGIIGYLQRDESFIGIEPLPTMKRTDADVALAAVWLNDIVYEEIVHDPLFLATRPWTYQQGGGRPDQTQYMADNAAGVVGCAEQYQYCVPQPGKEDFCTSLSGSPLENYIADFPHLYPVQLRLLQLLRSMSRLASFQDGAAKRNILAQNSWDKSISPGLPDDQWVKESVAWESRVWAAYQTLISTAVIGSKVFDEFWAEYTELLVDDGDRQLCQSIKMRKSGGFANVNVFALVFITAFAIVITLANTLVLRFLIFLSRFRAALAPRIDRWVQDGTYQLQRRAFDAHGQGIWVNLEQEIPITLEREQLKELPVESSVVLKTAEARHFARKAWLKKSGTSVTEGTLAEVEEDEGQIDKVVRRPTAGTDTMTLVSVDLERGDMNRVKCLDQVIEK